VRGSNSMMRAESDSTGGGEAMVVDCACRCYCAKSALSAQAGARCASKSGRVHSWPLMLSGMSPACNNYCRVLLMVSLAL
jgi:hypothetical protein